MDTYTLAALAMLGGLALSPDLEFPAWMVLFAVIVGIGMARWRCALLPLPGFFFGVLIGGSVPDGPVLRGPAVVQGRVVAAPTGRVGDLGVWACAREGGPFEPCRGRVRVVFPEPPSPASSWVVAGDGRKPRRLGLAGGPDQARAARLAGVRTVLLAKSVRPLGAPPEPRPVATGAVAVLDAVATGDRRGVDDAIWATLRDTGTSHLLAISGFHVGVVAGAVGGLFAWFSRRVGGVRPEGISRAWAWWAGAVAAVAYAWAAGAPISAQRAAGIVALAAVGRSLGRSVDAARLLAVAAAAVCVVDPGAVAAPGFQLSFGAVFGLLRFSPPLEACLRRAPAPVRWGGRGVVATCAATLGTLPAAAWWFQSLSLTSPLANLFAVPFMAVAVVPCAAVHAFAPEPLASWGTWAGAGAVRLLLVMLSVLRTEPLAPAVGPWGALLLCAIFLRVRLGWIASVLLLVLGLRSRSAGGLEVTFFDVGQGDAALVEHPDGRRWLVDGGRYPGLPAALRRRGVRHLDVVFASHADADHSAGLLPVLQELRVDELRLSRFDGHEALVDVAVARGIPVVLVPGAVPDGSDNDASLVVRAESPWGSVLFTGDVEALGESVLHQPATVLKVPHHGSTTSSSPGFLERVQPSLAVLSSGPNFYGHPHRSVVDRYAAHGIPLLRTDLDGTITVRLDPTGLSAHSEAGASVFSGARRASTPKMATASSASTMLNPWL